MKSRKQLLAVLMVLVFAICGITACKGKQDSSSSAAVPVAANLPLSGPLATYGTAVKEGVDFAIEQTKNDKGPLLKFDWQDNTSDPKNAVSIMQKQFLADPAIYVSGVKPQTMAINDQITSKGLPHFVWIFDPVINQGRSNNFRTWVSYKIEPPVYFSYAEKRKAKKVSILYVQLPHTIEEFEKNVIPGMKQRGLEVQVQVYDFSRNDFKDLVQKMKKFNPDLIILNGFQSELVAMTRALRPLSLITDGNTLATYDMIDAAKVLGPDELEGIRVVAPLFETRPDTPNIKEWKSAFAKRYNKEAIYTHAFAYDMASIIMDAGKKLEGKKPTSQDWIKTLRATDIKGITGPLKFDDDGDLVTPLEVGVYRAGKLIPDTDMK